MTTFNESSQSDPFVRFAAFISHGPGVCHCRSQVMRSNTRREQRSITIHFIHFYSSRVANCDNSISLDIYDHFPLALAKLPCGHKGRRTSSRPFSIHVSIFYFCNIFFLVPLIVVVVAVCAICLVECGKVRIMCGYQQQRFR